MTQYNYACFILLSVLDSWGLYAASLLKLSTVDLLLLLIVMDNAVALVQPLGPQ